MLCWPNGPGYQAIHLSGGGAAAGSLGLPDLGISTLDDVLTDIRLTNVARCPHFVGGCGYWLWLLRL